MYEKTTNIENKRLFYVKKQQAAEAMEESSLKKMKQYNADMREERTWNILCTEERELHEVETSGPLPVHFQSTSGPLPAPFWSTWAP